MGLYKHVSPKRHIAWCNAPTVQCLDLGKMCRALQKKSSSRPTARSYQSKRGEKRFAGTKHLKSTQTFVLQLELPFVWLWSMVVQGNHYWSIIIVGHFFVELCWLRSPGWQCHHAWHRLRTYPPRFGLRIALLHRRFCSKRVAVPEYVGPIPDGYHTFANSQWADWWDDACMRSVFFYLRGAKELNLGDWRVLFPTEI